MKNWQKKEKMSLADKRNFQKAGAFFVLAIAIAAVGWQRTSAKLEELNGQTASAVSSCEGKNALDHAACRRNTTGP